MRRNDFDGRAWLRPKEACRYYGISPKTVYLWWHDYGILKTVKIGNVRLVEKKTDLIDAPYQKGGLLCKTEQSTFSAIS